MGQTCLSGAEERGEGGSAEQGGLEGSAGGAGRPAAVQRAGLR